jgi:S-adenosylmethionine decarboxylase
VVSEPTAHFSGSTAQNFTDPNSTSPNSTAQSLKDQTLHHLDQPSNQSSDQFLGQPIEQPSEQSSTSVGTHCLLELYDCPAHILNDLALIEESLRCAAQVARSTLLSLTSQAFQPQGVTALALLAESHISIHTWPETGYAAVDVFTCGEHTRPQNACEYLAAQMQSQSQTMTKLFRRGQLPASSERTSSEQAVVSTA